jgi:hypothetical protein
MNSKLKTSLISKFTFQFLKINIGVKHIKTANDIRNIFICNSDFAKIYIKMEEILKGNLKEISKFLKEIRKK